MRSHPTGAVKVSYSKPFRCRYKLFHFGVVAMWCPSKNDEAENALTFSVFERCQALGASLNSKAQN